MAQELSPGRQWWRREGPIGTHSELKQEALFMAGDREREADPRKEGIALSERWERVQVEWWGVGRRQKQFDTPWGDVT